MGFMAGCAASSAYPEYVAKLVNDLKEIYPDLSVIQMCCGKPTKYMGQEALYEKRLAQFVGEVNHCNIDCMISLCQGCQSVLSHDTQIPTVSLWSILAEHGLPKECVGKGKDSDVVFAVHDSCPTRELRELHEAVRYLLKEELGYQVTAPKRSGTKTICCGMGGMCGVSNPPLAKTMATKRAEEVSEAGKYPIVTYCASCRSAMMLGGGNAYYLLDLIYGPVVTKKTVAPKDDLANSVTAWKNRYKAKKLLKDIF